MMVRGNPQLPSGQVSFAGNTPLVQAAGANVNGTPGNQLLNESVFVIPIPVQLDAPVQRRSRASGNPCPVTATPAPAA